MANFSILSQKIFIFFLLLFFLLSLITSKNYSESLEIVANWTVTKFKTDKGEIECKTCIPACIKISSNGTIFVSFPRLSDNVTATLATYNKETNLFEPWPNTSFNQLYLNNDTSGLNSVLGFEIDNKDTLYILDQGKINNNPAKINSAKLLIFELLNDTKTDTIIFDSSVADPFGSFLSNIVLTDDNSFAYISDSGISIDPEKYDSKPGLIVVNLNEKNYSKILENNFSIIPDDSFWLHVNNTPVNKNKPLRTGINGIALSCNGETLFYSPLSSRMIYSIRTKNIQQYIIEKNDSKLIIYEGFKKEASDGLLASTNGNLYMTGIETGSIYIAKNVDPDLLRFRFNDFEKLEGSDMTMWPDSMTLFNGNLFFVSNQLNNFPDDIDYDHPKNGKYNFAIFKFEIDDNDESYIKGCLSSTEKSGIGSIIIWIFFAVVILIVLSFVLMGSNSQEEVIDKHMNLGVNKED